MNFTLIDLTHSLSPAIPIWDDSCGFEFKVGDNNDEVFMYTSSGTHIDAPSHFRTEEQTIDKLELEQLCAAACVIDVSDRATADYVISAEDMLAYEKTHGTIAENSLVIALTGWSRHWGDVKAYRNADANGDLHYPSFSMEAVVLLLKRGIVGIGIDTFSPELICRSTSYPIHQLLFSKGKYIIENLANCHLLPPKGAHVIALPLKILNGGEAPARVIALVP